MVVLTYVHAHAQHALEWRTSGRVLTTELEGRENSMKAIIATVVAMFVAPFASAQSAASLGVFENTKHFGKWMFSEVRELDGALSGCFMSTRPVQGAYSFEDADLNILSLRQDGQIIKKVALLDVADPEQAGSPLAPFAWLLKVGSSGERLPYFVPLMFKKRHANGRLMFEGEVSEEFLDELAKGQVANAGFGRTIVYSLRGSGKAVNLWRKCDSQLQ